MTKKINEQRYSAASLFAEIDRNRGSLWLSPSTLPVWGCVLPLDKHLVYWQIAFMRTLFLDQHSFANSTLSFFEPRFSPDGRLWCAPGLAPLALQPPAIICVLYCEGVNKSTTAPLSVPSVSEASALAFCCVIYARLLPKMSFLSLTALAACERAWHLSVFINFKDAFACFCHSLCSVSYQFPFVFVFLFPKSVALSLPPSLSGLNTSGVTCYFCLYPFPFSFVVTPLYKRITEGNMLSRVTLCCTLDTGELRLYSLLWSFSSAYTSLRG